jgi:hypothetical protein
MAIDLNELIKFLNDHSYAVYFDREPLSIIGDMCRINRIEDGKLARSIMDFNARSVDSAIHNHPLGTGFAQKDDKAQDEETE